MRSMFVLYFCSFVATQGPPWHGPVSWLDSGKAITALRCSLWTWTALTAALVPLKQRSNSIKNEDTEMRGDMQKLQGSSCHAICSLYAHCAGDWDTDCTHFLQHILHVQMLGRPLSLLLQLTELLMNGKICGTRSDSLFFFGKNRKKMIPIDKCIGSSCRKQEGFLSSAAPLPGELCVGICRRDGCVAYFTLRSGALASLQFYKDQSFVPTLVADFEISLKIPLNIRLCLRPRKRTESITWDRGQLK